jgi:hypothetical protein
MLKLVAITDTITPEEKEPRYIEMTNELLCVITQDEVTEPLQEAIRLELIVTWRETIRQVELTELLLAAIQTEAIELWRAIRILVLEIQQLEIVPTEKVMRLIKERLQSEKL